MNKSLQIGLTGGIGSGKSLISRIFQSLGISVYDADEHAKELMNTDPALKTGITELFGEKSYSEGRLDRRMIATRVFHNPPLLKQMNSLIHPRVREDYQAWREEQHCPYTVKEAALLFESRSYLELDRVITVYAPENLRIQRVLIRDPQRTESEIKDIIARQIKESERLDLADEIIYNDNSRMVIPQVLQLDASFRDAG